MKKHFFLFFISLFSSFGYLDTEVESYVDTQHKEIFGFLNNNQELLEKDKDSFLEEFEIKLSKLIPPSEISKRVMGKKFFNRASQKQIQNFNEKFKTTLLDSYSGALQNIQGSNIILESHFHPNERMDLAVVQLKTEFSGRKFKLIYKMKMIQIEGSKNWRVVGNVLDGIDLISIYRRQFASLANEYNEDLDQVINSWSIDEDSINFEN